MRWLGIITCTHPEVGVRSRLISFYERATTIIHLVEAGNLTVITGNTIGRFIVRKRRWVIPKKNSSPISNNQLIVGYCNTLGTCIDLGGSVHNLIINKTKSRGVKDIRWFISRSAFSK